MNSLFRVGTLVIVGVLAINYYFNNKDPLSFGITSEKSHAALVKQSEVSASQVVNNKERKIESDDINLTITNFANEMIAGYENETDVDWKLVHTDWLNRLRDHLEDKYQKPILANNRLSNYIQIKRYYLNDPELKEIYQKNDKILAKVIATDEDKEANPMKYQKAILNFINAQKEINDFKHKEELALKDYWGNEYREIQDLLQDYNKEISDDNSHLGYEIGVRL
mgnify:CR=1 FL=1